MEPAEVLIAHPIIPQIPLVTEMKREIPVKSCPWGKASTVEVVSLNEVMSEQLATSLMEEDNLPPDPGTAVHIDDMKGCGEEVTDCSDDFIVAQLLQLEFDKQHDELLKQEEFKYNQTSKVKVSYGKYLRLPATENISSDEDDTREERLEMSERNHWSNFEQAEKTFQAVGRSGVSRQGNTTTTKHDLTVSGRRNAGRLMEFPISIPTGDAGMFDMKIPNIAMGALKNYSNAEMKRLKKLHDKKEKSTAEKALDEKTHLILYKLINNETLDSVSGCISSGKEACVFYSRSGSSEDGSPLKEYAIKIYKTTLNEFQNRDQYIKDDHRFRNRFSKQNPRKVIHMWAEKEMRNLLRMKEANIPCPEVVVLKKHVLVMTFIGKEMLPAPIIKDLDLSFEDWTIMYDQTVEIMKTLYGKCRLVHADFSEYNLLWYEDKVWVIDVSQSVETTHSRAHEFLLRDCTNVSTFFQKKGVVGVPNPEGLFSEICGLHPDAAKKNIVDPKSPKSALTQDLESTCD